MYKKTRVPVLSLKQSRKTIKTTFGSRSSLPKTRKPVEEKRSSWLEQPDISVPVFGHSFGQISVQSPGRSPIQAKLTIEQSGDKYEQEADRVAQQVMRMPETRSPIGRISSANDPSPLVNREIEQRIQQERTQGKPLSEAIRVPMEHKFGVDFSGVKVHATDAADKLSRSLNAKAFTTEQDIFFRKGEYDLTNRNRRGLLAHELTHVVQQGRAKWQSMQLPGSSGAQRLQRQELATPATLTAQEEYIQDAIGMLHHGAAIYQRGQSVDRARLVRQLDGWMSIVQTAITFINVGSTDAQVSTTAENLRLAYQRAVSALLSAASSQLNQTLQALHEQHSHRIHVWASPLATRPRPRGTLSTRAQQIIARAQDSSVPIDRRAVETVRAIISTYYPTEVGLFREIEYKADEPGLRTQSPSRMTPTPTAQGKLFVGRYFITHTTRRGFARRVLQVDHELEHMRQQRRGQGGGRRSALREFLAFTREALAQERSGTGRVSHSTRVSLIDEALKNYYQLSANQRATYAYDRDRLLEARREHARQSGRSHPPPPSPASTRSTP